MRELGQWDELTKRNQATVTDRARSLTDVSGYASPYAEGLESRPDSARRVVDTTHVIIWRNLAYSHGLWESDTVEVRCKADVK